MLTVLAVYCGVGVVWLTVALVLDYEPGDATFSAILWPAWVLRGLAKVADLLGD